MAYLSLLSRCSDALRQSNVRERFHEVYDQALGTPVTDPEVLSNPRRRAFQSQIEGAANNTGRVRFL